MKDVGPILVVEDDPDDVELTLRAFEKAGLANRIEVVRDGVEAIDRLFGPGKEGRESPALVLLDLNLPRVDGHEVLRRIRAGASTRLIPVVILSSSKEEKDLVESYSLGANSYVRKPVDFNEFQDAVGKLGCYWLLMNERPPAAP